MQASSVATNCNSALIVLHMDSAVPTSNQPSGVSTGKRWCGRKPVCACWCRKILLLFFWQALFACHDNSSVLVTDVMFDFGLSLMIISPFIGWLADVKLGRYKVIVFASLVAFLSSIVYFLGFIFGDDYWSKITSLTYIVESICRAGFSAAMLPFVTDQLIGASSDELSSVVHWFYFFQQIGMFFVTAEVLLTNQLWLVNATQYFSVNIAGLFLCAVLSPALIIISDCLCLQWLDRTHKVTNPIKLIIQVLNYTRKHKYPERRSAFTYLDEEQPSRLDFGKVKFGGPFTEEEVEDVKTILRLVPIVCCISFIANVSWNLDIFTCFGLSSKNVVIYNFITGAMYTCFFPLFLIPLYQLVIFPFFHNWIPSILKQIGTALTLKTLGIILFTATEIKGLTNIPGGLEGYLNCTGNLPTEIVHIEWYWGIIPVVLYCIGTTMASLLLLEFIIAQAPQKMKGLVIGMSLTISGLNALTNALYYNTTYTLCCHLPLVILPVAFYALFLFLAKQYTLRERNREINIQAIVEEHYERYLDQEEEYMRQHH